jgi:hypothetical protein
MRGEIDVSGTIQSHSAQDLIHNKRKASQAPYIKLRRGAAVVLEEEDSEEALRKKEYKRLVNSKVPCYRNYSFANSPVPAKSPHPLQLVILSSRIRTINASIATWMTLLPKDTMVELAIDRRVYQNQQAEWDKVPLRKIMYTTMEAKTPYRRAADVLLASVKRNVLAAAEGSFDADWIMFVDDDTFVNPPRLVQWLQKQNPTKAIMTGAIYNGNLVGGLGIVMSRAALGHLDGTCFNSWKCDLDTVFGDVAVTAAVGFSAVSQNFSDDFQLRNQDKTGSPTFHPCDPACMYDAFGSLEPTGHYQDYMSTKPQLWQHSDPTSISSTEVAAC